MNAGRSEPPEQRLFAVRGAVQAAANDADSILAATEELMRELIERNALAPERIVSCIFTCTDDLEDWLVVSLTSDYHLTIQLNDAEPVDVVL